MSAVVAVVVVAGGDIIEVVARIDDYYRLEAIGVVVGSFEPKSMARNLANPMLRDWVRPFSTCFDSSLNI